MVPDTLDGWELLQVLAHRSDFDAWELELTDTPEEV